MCTPHHPLITSVTVAKIKYPGHLHKLGIHISSLPLLAGLRVGGGDVEHGLDMRIVLLYFERKSGNSSVQWVCECRTVCQCAGFTLTVTENNSFAHWFLIGVQ